MDETEELLNHPRTTPLLAAASCSHSWSSLIKSSMESAFPFLPHIFNIHTCSRDFRASRRCLKDHLKNTHLKRLRKSAKSTPKKTPNFACFFFHRPQLRPVWLFSWCIELLARRSLVVLRRL